MTASTPKGRRRSDGVFTEPSTVGGSNRESAKWIAIKKKRPLKS
jgi:hypothetical protein